MVLHVLSTLLSAIIIFEVGAVHELVEIAAKAVTAVTRSTTTHLSHHSSVYTSGIIF
jgi:hypothetical protein